MSIKVSHEVPISLLELSRGFNDYDYCLPHLLDQSLEYEQFFRDSKAQGRYIIMDNSLHELGKAYNTERLLHWINELEPNEFIVPDVWQDKTATLLNAEKWRNIPLPENTTKVAVVQGKGGEWAPTNDAFDCYRELKELGYEKIAFSYGADYYNEVFPHPNKNISKMLGRVKTISYLYDQDIIGENDRIHLLGCQLPQEFIHYTGFDFIESIDTSNPIMATLDQTIYQSYGLLNKPEANMNDNINIKLEVVDMELLDHNLAMFKKINNL